MTSVRLEAVTKIFNGRKVLDNVNLEIEDQSFTVLLGPPGAGKTTIFRIIAGVDHPDSGRIFFGDDDVTALSPKKRKTGLVFQSYALYPHMSAYENIASPLKALKMKKPEIDRRVNLIADALGISMVLKKLPKEMSGGQRQRVAIARSIVKEANIYMLDEPLTNVDYKIRETMRIELKKIFKEHGGTILYATPDPQEARSLGQYVAMVMDGKIEQYGLTAEVYGRPKNAKVGRYFSYPPMNQYHGKLVEDRGRYFIEVGVMNVDVTHAANELQNSGEREYIVGIRPNQIKLAEEAVEKPLKLELETMLTELIGSESLLHLKFGDQKMVVHVPTMRKFEPGEKVRVTFDQHDAYLFCKQTGDLVYAPAVM